MAASGTVTSTYVASVNDETGQVELDAADVGALPTAATVAGDATSGRLSLPHVATGAAGYLGLDFSRTAS